MTKTELLKVIRKHCLDCCYDSATEVELCGCTNCALFLLRFGKDPSPRVLSPEEKAKRAALLMANVEKSRRTQNTEAPA